MSIRKLLRKVSISYDGSILLGKHVACDSFEKGRIAHIFTHIHSDHLIGFGSSLGALGTEVMVSVPTKDLLVAMEGRHLLKRTNFIALDWNNPHEVNEETVTLYPTKHILGSSQVLVEDEEGYRIVYTGDFNSNTKPLNANILVADATCGSLSRNYAMSNLTEEIVSIVQRRLRKDEPIYLFSRRCMHARLMRLFRTEGIDIPFVLPPLELKIAQVYEKHRGKIGDSFSVDTMDAWEMMRREDPYVAFYPLGSRVFAARKYLKIKAVAYGAPFPIFMPRKNLWVVALSDHADFKDTLDYVRQSKPELVITDGFRTRENASFLAQAIKKELGIETRTLP